jgi:hypothetical protein
MPQGKTSGYLGIVPYDPFPSDHAIALMERHLKPNHPPIDEALRKQLQSDLNDAISIYRSRSNHSRTTTVKRQHMVKIARQARAYQKNPQSIWRLKLLQSLKCKSWPTKNEDSFADLGLRQTLDRLVRPIYTDKSVLLALPRLETAIKLQKLRNEDVQAVAILAGMTRDSFCDRRGLAYPDLPDFVYQTAPIFVQVTGRTYKRVSIDSTGDKKCSHFIAWVKELFESYNLSQPTPSQVRFVVDRVRENIDVKILKKS